MIIDLKRTVIKIQLRRFITLIAFVIVIIFIMLLGSLKDIYLGLTKYQWAMIVSVLYIIFAIYESLLDFNYIYFNDEGNKILFRYFSMSFFNRKKQSIEIPKEFFGGYTVEKSLAGIKQKLTLYQRIKDKNAKYPSVSITALSKMQTSDLLKTLDKYR
jgi:hypothetical protein